MGNYLTKARSLLVSGGGLLASKFKRSRGKKRKHGYFSRSTANESSYANENDMTDSDTDSDYFPDSDSDDDDEEEDNSFVPRRRLRAYHNEPTTTTPTESSNRPRRVELNTRRHKPARRSAPHTSSAASSKSKCHIDAKLSTPARKRMKSTSTYVYNTLFLAGECSDLVVKALGKEWRLHKVYLCQSPYFASMFKSEWAESGRKIIDIAIPDPHIDERALFVAFGSFYKEEIEIAPLEVTSVLACASLFSLDGLIAQCASVMSENVNYKTVIGYHDAANMYGVNSVAELAVKWLCTNLLSNAQFVLADLRLALLDKVLARQDLLIVQVETDLYTLCKKWLYAQLNKDGKPLDKNWQKTCNEFFKALLAGDANESGIDAESEANAVNNNEEANDFDVAKTGQRRSVGRKECLLDKPELAKYACVFRKVRLQHILTDMASLNILYSDRIIPHDWIEPHYLRNWLNALYIDQDNMSQEFQISRSEFDANCARFGRSLANNDGTSTWRWVGFNYGIDLVVTHRNHTLTIQRNALMSPYRGLLSNKQTQRIYYVMRVVQLDQFGNEKWSKQTEFTCVDLVRNEEKFVLSIDNCVKYPVFINLRVATHPIPSSSLLDNSTE